MTESMVDLKNPFLAYSVIEPSKLYSSLLTYSKQQPELANMILDELESGNPEFVKKCRQLISGKDFWMDIVRLSFTDPVELIRKVETNIPNGSYTAVISTIKDYNPEFFKRYPSFLN